MGVNLEFFKDKTVLITGHTGFKGAWLCHILKRAGANVCGYALEAERGSLFEVLSVSEGMNSIINDIRDMAKLAQVFHQANPEIVLHFAAQPLVLDSYARPAYTFDTNVMGTVNLLECVRESETVRSVVIVTTDKVYKNLEWAYGYREVDTLGGSDPYSASKACAEIVSEAYRTSFLHPKNTPISTARAGNVIGGGDISANRIIPDCVRAAVKGKPIIIRNPSSVRPYQHVLEPLCAYLHIAELQYKSYDFAGNYNIGPEESDCVTTGELADIFCNAWGENQSWVDASDLGAPHEANLLRLDCSKIRSKLGWRPVWNLKTAIAKTVEWEKAHHAGEDITTVMNNQIDEYLEGVENGGFTR
ncbi:MAG: CDP-glucose 4,6-dehydratase [Oscillospiraceae bacterium]|nr:CDP-glucose 4,6-dehydratase [Oscillospiraceae bacterium]